MSGTRRERRSPPVARQYPACARRWRIELECRPEIHPAPAARTVESRFAGSFEDRLNELVRESEIARSQSLEEGPDTLHQARPLGGKPHAGKARDRESMSIRKRSTKRLVHQYQQGSDVSGRQGERARFAGVQISKGSVRRGRVGVRSSAGQRLSVRLNGLPGAALFIASLADTPACRRQASGSP